MGTYYPKLNKGGINMLDKINPVYNVNEKTLNYSIFSEFGIVILKFRKGVFFDLDFFEV